MSNLLRLGSILEGDEDEVGGLRHAGYDSCVICVLLVHCDVGDLDLEGLKGGNNFLCKAGAVCSLLFDDYNFLSLEGLCHVGRIARSLKTIVGDGTVEVRERTSGEVGTSC